eukprot:14980-Prymnesium_polylepis.1
MQIDEDVGRIASDVPEVVGVRREKSALPGARAIHDRSRHQSGRRRRASRREHRAAGPHVRRAAVSRPAVAVDAERALFSARDPCVRPAAR